MNLKEDDTKCSRIEIVVTEPRKMGDGMNAYVAYKITTKVIPNTSHSIYLLLCFPS